MKTLISGNRSYLTGDDIADAVLTYGLALSKRRDLDIVDIPFVAESGAVHRVELTIGWQAGIVAISDGAPADEILEIGTILDLYARAELISTVRAQAFSDEELEKIDGHFLDEE